MKGPSPSGAPSHSYVERHCRTQTTFITRVCSRSQKYTSGRSSKKFPCLRITMLQHVPDLSPGHSEPLRSVGFQCSARAVWAPEHMPCRRRSLVGRWQGARRVQMRRGQIRVTCMLGMLGPQADRIAAQVSIPSAHQNVVASCCALIRSRITYLSPTPRLQKAIQAYNIFSIDIHTSELLVGKSTCGALYWCPALK